MKTLHTAYRVTDLAASLDFYTALGYHEVGHIQSGDGSSLTVLKLPADQVGALELIHRPADEPVDIGTGFGYIVVQVDDIACTVEALSQAGLMPGALVRHAGPEGPQTSQLTDPDGYHIELVEWPPGHPDGITAADFG
ncbi:MAG: VOC family protein [Actinomycetes bacterium]